MIIGLDVTENFTKVIIGIRATRSIKAKLWQNAFIDHRLAM